MMVGRVSGSLQHVLRVSRVAWYCGDDGTRAYIEMPYARVLGLMAVNGKKVMDLVNDGKDAFTPSTQEKMAAYGVRLDRGWACQQEAHGIGINEALSESNCGAARHHNGWLQIHLVDNHQCCIVMRGEKRWTGSIACVHNILAEWAFHTWDGWFPITVRQPPSYRQVPSHIRFR